MTKEHKIKGGANYSSITSAYSHETAIEVHSSIISILSTLKTLREDVLACSDISSSETFDEDLEDLLNILDELIIRSCNIASTYLSDKIIS